jgi:hypothetical protein
MSGRNDELDFLLLQCIAMRERADRARANLLDSLRRLSESQQQARWLRKQVQSRADRDPFDFPQTAHTS